VMDIIAQHHGTGLMAYFYRKALWQSSGVKEKVNKESFRYPGPKPSSKESAIVMLADSVEAGFRFSPSKSHQATVNQVERIIDNKIKDGQLDKCDLTMKELNKLRDAFTRVLTGIIHSRGRYPDEMLKQRPFGLKIETRRKVVIY